MLVIGEIIETTPRTKLVETTVEPSKFPAINSEFELRAENAEKKTSGKAVPKPTINTPIITSGMFNSLAKKIADFTIPCDAIIKSNIPIAKFLIANTKVLKRSQIIFGPGLCTNSSGSSYL